MLKANVDYSWLEVKDAVNTTLNDQDIFEDAVQQIFENNLSSAVKYVAVKFFRNSKDFTEFPEEIEIIRRAACQLHEYGYIGKILN